MTETTEQLESAACEAMPELTRLEGARRRVLIRRARYMVLDELHKGNRDPQSIEEEVTTKLKADPVVGSLVAIIAIALLSGFIQWLIKRILDRWFPEEDDS